MNYLNKLKSLIDDKNGLILTKDVIEEGIPREYLNQLLRENKLERIAYGVYLTPDAFYDEMYRIQARNTRTVFSHETALFLHDLTDRDPLEWSVTVPYGYNATHLREEGIKVYNKERIICDILRNRNNMDIAILNDGVKRYLNSKDKNIPLLMRYAEELNIQEALRKYVEILL